MRALCRAKDWGATVLGPPHQWSPALRALVRAAFDSPFPINIWAGPDLQLIYNDAYRVVLGSKHPEALGSPGFEVWREIRTEIQPMFDEIARGGPPVFAEDAPFVVLREGRETDAWFTFALSGVRDESGEIIAYLNVVSETTGRVLAEQASEMARAHAERAEAQLREVFAQAPSFLAVVRGRQHIFEYVNAAYYQLVGHRDLVGRPVFEALPEVRGQGFEELLDNVLNTGVPFVGREVPVSIQRTPDSQPEERFVDLVYYPIRDEHGNRSGVVAHGSDVTEHVLARREAQRARAEAEQANQAKSQFLANMSHEIRTPINAVLGYADLMDAGVTGELKPRQREYLERILSSSRHLLGLVNDVLDLSKIEAGEMLVRADRTQAIAIVETTVQMVASQAAARQLAIQHEWQCSEATEVVADAGRARQILLNLLSNAIKFTEPHGEITIRCRLAEMPTAKAALPDVGPWLLLEVEDTGVGIGDEQMARIFDPFVQAETGHTRTFGGTGLGLTISRRLARLMGGDLTAESHPGQGSLFSLWLPVPSQQALPGLAVDWGSATALPQTAQELPGLGALAKLLIAASDRLEAEAVDRIRTDREIPSSDGLDRNLIADHIAAQLVIMAKLMTALDSGGLTANAAADSEDLHRVLAERHGAQRRRLGWQIAEVRRELEIMHQVIDAFMRREAARSTTADVRKAIAVVHRLLDLMAGASLAGYSKS